MEQYLEFVSIHFWTMIFTWINLVILFLLLKKFLFKPVNKVIDERAEEIENTYKTAETALSDAENTRREYTERLSLAKSEAEGIIQSAVQTARERSDSIIGEAQDEARQLTERAQRQIERDKKQAVDEARGEIAEMAVDVAEKLIGKRLDESADEKLIESIIDRM